MLKKSFPPSLHNFQSNISNSSHPAWWCLYIFISISKHEPIIVTITIFISVSYRDMLLDWNCSYFVWDPRIGVDGGFVQRSWFGMLLPIQSPCFCEKESVSSQSMILVVMAFVFIGEIYGNGVLIVEGGEFEWEETTRCSLPFVWSWRILPSLTQSPWRLWC